MAGPEIRTADALGSYSQWGIVESWSICPEDYGWCERRKGSNPQDYYTRKKDTQTVYAIYLPEKGVISLPAEIDIEGATPATGAKVTILGASGNLKWQKTDMGFKVFVPARLQNNLPCNEAWSFRISEIM